MTIRGSGFVEGATVTIGGAATEVDVVSEEEIKATTAAGSGEQVVTVIDEDGHSSAGPVYTYLPPPTVESITPTEGPTTGGTEVTIKGTGFVGPARVTIGDGELTNVVVKSETEITGTTPEGAGEQELVVIDAGELCPWVEAHLHLHPSTHGHEARTGERP